MKFIISGGLAARCREAGEPVYYHDIALCGMQAMKENVQQAMRVFAGL